MKLNILIIIFSMLLGIVLVFHFNAKNNAKRVRDMSGYKIFVSIPSYRDNECPETVYNLFENAKYPSRIHIGIFQQNSESEDIDCEMQYCSLNENCRNNQITIKRVDYKEAKGPTHARVKLLEMIKNEDFFLSIDSHTRFSKHWDKKLIDQWLLCDNEKAILTTYPRPYEPEKHDNQSNMSKIPHLCKTWFDKGMPRGKAVYVNKQDTPILTSLYSANFAFMPMNAMKEAPLDPHTPNLFSGEEFYVAARFWTNGYDFYTPQTDIIYHFYTRNDAPKFWEEVPNYKEQREKSENRVRKQFGLSYDSSKIYDKDIEKYKMGNKRSFKQYLDFTKVDLENKKELEDNCKINSIEKVEY